MSEDEMVEKAARAIADNGPQPGTVYASDRDAARAALDAADVRGLVEANRWLDALVTAIAAERNAALAEVERQRSERVRARGERDEALADLADEQATSAILQVQVERVEALRDWWEQRPAIQITKGYAASELAAALTTPPRMADDTPRDAA
jgi:hypothetical protein